MVLLVRKASHQNNGADVRWQEAVVSQGSSITLRLHIRRTLIMELQSKGEKRHSHKNCGRNPSAMLPAQNATIRRSFEDIGNVSQPVQHKSESYWLVCLSRRFETFRWDQDLCECGGFGSSRDVKQKPSQCWHLVGREPNAGSRLNLGTEGGPLYINPLHFRIIAKSNAVQSSGCSKV